MKNKSVLTLLENDIYYTDSCISNAVEYGLIMKQIDFDDAYFMPHLIKLKERKD